jgi:hypothetical protein
MGKMPNRKENETAGNWQTARESPRAIGQAVGLSIPFEPEDDTAFGQVVGGHLHADAVTDGEPHEMFTHLARDMGQDLVIVVEFYPEHGAGQNSQNAAFNCYVLFHTKNAFIFTAKRCL